MSNGWLVVELGKGKVQFIIQSQNGVLVYCYLSPTIFTAALCLRISDERKILLHNKTRDRYVSQI